MLDMYDFQNDIWLCHSIDGICFNFTAFQPAINALKEIEKFLSINPSEVITIFIEDYVNSPQGLTKVFNASGLSKFFFPSSEMPKNGEDWPSISEMINKNHRLLVFTSKKSKEASEGISYQWNYLIESQYGDEGMKMNSIINRAESLPLNTTSRSLLLMNFFPTDPNSTDACVHNSVPLISMIENFPRFSSNRWPNFVAVDFYMESNARGPYEAVDKANGHMICGCDNFANCKVNNCSFGTCVVPSKASRVWEYFNYGFLFITQTHKEKGRNSRDSRRPGGDLTTVVWRSAAGRWFDDNRVEVGRRSLAGAG
ncbi:PI-PLC X domain-containing protein At5g67130-like [Dendrobium catenatum]|uniref:PI-PLC X domain-containing protein At5g67130-like n=1 Tax=Dendrobium catenatum TaxID=906689 RepID=UPI0010A01184|nr:PI-PLC X domain-containing protein At5g67130-like [Dendrobium catenatum]